MIQSIVYVPTYADGQVQFNTYYVDFATGGGHDWKSVVNVNEVAVRFRVSPSSAAKELIDNFGKETAKYNVAVDYQTVKTRATGELFNITKIEAVKDEANLIEVTLDASKAAASYAIALTLTDKVEGEAKTLNDISSNYFVAVKNVLYIDKVEWTPKEKPTTLVKGNTIDYKTGGDYTLTVHSSVDASGDVEGEADTRKKLSQYGISADKFPMELTLGGTNAANFELSEAGVLSAKEAAVVSNVAKVSYTITVSGLGASSEKTVEYTGDYGDVKLITEGEAQEVVLAAAQLPLLWNGVEKSYTLDVTAESATVAAVAKIKEALGVDNFNNCTFAAVPETQTIKLGNSSGALVLKVPASTVCEATDITTRITSQDGNKSIDVTVKGVTVSYPDANDAAFKLINNAQTWDGSKAVLGRTFEGAGTQESNYTAVKATRNLKELYSNYAAVESSFTGLGSGATLEFAPVLAEGEGSITGVTVSKSGDVTVTKSYEGDPIKVTLTGKCGEHEVFSKEIAVTIPADKLNGTFAYSAEKPEDQGKLTYDVTSIEKRKEGLDLKTALVWKDATAAENEIWPEAAENIYSNNKPMTIYGFSVEYTMEEGLHLASRMPYRLSEPNVLLMDMAEYRFDSGEWMEREEILRLDNVCREIAGYPLRMEAFAQPWTSEKSAPEHTLELRFAIDSEIEVEDAFLALEESDATSIWLNGKEVKNSQAGTAGQADSPEDSGYFVDECIRKVALPHIPVGRSELLLKISYSRNTNVEWYYLLGSFGVKVTGSRAVLTPLPEQIAFGDYVDQGFPFYAGNMIYETEITVEEAGEYIIAAEKFRAPLLKVLIDGKQAGRIALAPYQVQLGHLEKGKHAVTIISYGNRVNAFGTVHACNEYEHWVGPNAWRTTGAGFSYEYQLKRMGVLAAPRVFLVK